MNDFIKYAKSNKGVNTSGLQKYLASSRLLLPSIIEERQQNIGSYDIFSRLMTDRIIFLGQEIDDDVSNVIQAELLYLSSIDPDKPISMYINSPGGVCTSGLAIYDTMQMVPCPVSTTCTGMAASMAAVLLCAGEKGQRFILPHSRVMIHQPSGGAFGQASDVLIAAKEMENLKKELLTIVSDHTGQPYKKVLKDSDRDYWMNANEALQYGLVDELLIGKKHNMHDTNDTKNID